MPLRYFKELLLLLEAEKQSSVAQIQFNQKIMEKESQKKISEIEGKSMDSLWMFFKLFVSKFYVGQLKEKYLVIVLIAKQ